MAVQPSKNGACGPYPNHMVLRIDDYSDSRGARLRLSGRIQAGDLASIRSETSGLRMSTMLDLTDFTLVDIAVVRFLICCEDEGVELVQCPPYVREWMTRERFRGDMKSRIRRG